MAAPVPQKDDVEHWTVEQVAAWLQQVQLSDCCDTFLRKGIDGHSFLQLSEEDLFLWGRDVSIRNRKQILKLVSQIKNLQQLSSTTRHFIDDAADCDVSDSRNEEEMHEYTRQEMQLSHEKNAQGEDLYLVPLPARPTTTHSSIPDRRLTQPPSQLHFSSSNYPSPHHQGTVPWNLHSPSKEPPFAGCKPGSDIQDSGRSSAPPIPARISGRAPAPLPDPLMVPSKKISPKDPRVPLQFQVPPPDMIICSPSLGTKVSQKDIHPGTGMQSYETNTSDIVIDHLNDDFASSEWNREKYEYNHNLSSDEEWPQDYPEKEMEPSQEGTIQGEEGIEDLYVIPLPASPIPDHSSTQDRKFSRPPMPTRLLFKLKSPTIMQHHGRVPWNLHPENKEASSVRHKIESDTHDNGRNSAPPVPDRIPGRNPAPLLEPVTIPQKFQIRSPNVAIHSPLSGTSMNQNGPTENGGIGVRGDSFLHRHQFPANVGQDKRLHSPPKWPLAKESSQALIAQEKNDHVYEIVDIPQGSYGSPETSKTNISDQQCPVKPPIPPPRNQNQGFEDRDLSSQLGSISLPKTKCSLATPQGITRKQSGGGHGTSQMWPSSPGSPSRTNCRRQPKASTSLPANSFHTGHNTVTEMEAPQELAPQVPSETNLPSVSLGDGECIRLIPLYQKILEKPYFHLITRPHAKRLVMNGGEGIYLIRPSTRSDKPLTLTLKHDGRYYNINIRQRPDTLFALGNEKDQEQAFSSIDEIVSYHHKEPIKLESGECALLKYSPPKLHNTISVQHGIPSPVKF